MVQMKMNSLMWNPITEDEDILSWTCWKGGHYSYLSLMCQPSSPQPSVTLVKERRVDREKEERGDIVLKVFMIHEEKMTD